MLNDSVVSTVRGSVAIIPKPECLPEGNGFMSTEFRTAGESNGIVLH